MGAAARCTPEGFARHDLFRLAQAYFSLHQRLLGVRVPGPAGLMHWSYPLPLRILGWQNVYTVHDTIPFTRPDLTPIDPVRPRRVLTQVGRARHC